MHTVNPMFCVAMFQWEAQTANAHLKLGSKSQKDWESIWEDHQAEEQPCLFMPSCRVLKSPHTCGFPLQFSESIIGCCRQEAASSGWLAATDLALSNWWLKRPCQAWNMTCCTDNLKMVECTSSRHWDILGHSGTFEQNAKAYLSPFSFAQLFAPGSAAEQHISMRPQFLFSPTLSHPCSTLVPILFNLRSSFLPGDQHFTKHCITSGLTKRQRNFFAFRPSRSFLSSLSSFQPEVNEYLLKASTLFELSWDSIHQWLPLHMHWSEWRFSDVNRDVISIVNILSSNGRMLNQGVECLVLRHNSLLISI